MVNIVEVDEQPDADRDEECYEIDPAEFAKKVNPKETEDLVLVAAKGKIKVEVVEPEDVAKYLSGHGDATSCSLLHDAGGVTHGNRPEFATGDSMDNPYQIEEDEPILLQMEIVEDSFALDPSQFGADNNNKIGKCIQGCEDQGRTEFTPYKIVVNSEPDDLDGVECVVHDAYNHCNGRKSEHGADDDKQGQFFHGDKDDVDVISDKLLEKLGKPTTNNDNPVANCKPVDGDSLNGAEEDKYDHCPEMIPKQRIFDEDDEEDVVVV